MKLTIDNRVIKHLGKDLITSSDVAVVELVKNSMDANASNITLQLYDDFTDAPELDNRVINKLIPHTFLQCPLLIVSDDGKGMTDDELQKGFLTVGTNIKEDSGELLGSKGIGRLATNRLGKALLVETCSDKEDHTTFIFMDWNKIIEGQRTIPSYKTSKTTHHTRLWIFDVDLNDYIENAIQFQQEAMLPYYEAIANRELKTALCFLISPFTKEKDIPKIKVFYRDKEVDCHFQTEMLSIAEAQHSFSLIVNENGIIGLKCELKLMPWFAERVHRALVKSSAFERLKQPHDYYEQLIKKNNTRIENALCLSLDENDLSDCIKDMLKSMVSSFGKTENEINQYNDYLDAKVKKIIQCLKEISPLNGVIYSYKQGVTIGEKIAIESATSLGYATQNITLSDLKRFLDDNNGIKLYRKIYRIGFLGNKESDWIKLQQFRTKGQQWYRFDLGNTVGYVSLSDANQTKIQEISSRLDISQNDYSESFKTCINLIFNYFFYDLNKKANDVIKVLLEEDGKLGNSLAQRAKKNDELLKRMQSNRNVIKKHIENLAKQFEEEIVIDGEYALIPKRNYQQVSESVQKLQGAVKIDEQCQEETNILLKDAAEQLNSLQIEAYNNYKLMANGIITEIITHELDSIVKTSMLSFNSNEHFNTLRKHLVEMEATWLYNQHLFPIRRNYDAIFTKMQQVGSMYTFLETTFVRKGSYDAFVMQNIEELILKVKENILQAFTIKHVDFVLDVQDLVWTVPKGVLVHIFYNLFSNSLYWIDIRRKWAQNDKKYMREKGDEIVINAVSENEIIVSDSGTGVIRSMEDILFEPLESGKNQDERRGMGLYIVKKLMQSFGGDIELMQDRNEYGHRYKFLLTVQAREE